MSALKQRLRGGTIFQLYITKRSFIIVCNVHFGHFLLNEQCSCEWRAGEEFRFGEESLSRHISVMIVYMMLYT